jgi:hypothetical protein
MKDEVGTGGACQAMLPWAGKTGRMEGNTGGEEARQALMFWAEMSQMGQT